MNTFVAWIDRTFYPNYGDNWDNTLLRDLILEHISPNFAILDLGAGSGAVEAMNFQNHARKIVGIDLCPEVKNNPFLHEAYIRPADNTGLESESFDLVFSNNVLEHLENPSKVFTEVWRLLKPGGRFIFKTPNKAHYVSLIGRFSPHLFHVFINKLRGRRAEDTFPTLYRANSPKTLTHLLKQARFQIEDMLILEGRPEYLRFNAATYLVGLLYERAFARFDCFRNFRVVIIGTAVKS